jgi:hypothetical protein
VGFPPPLLLNRSSLARVVLALVVPSAYGFLTGVFLDNSKGVYLVLVILAAVGGVLAGFEMKGPGQGALRGVVGGALFGGFILIAHELVSGDATVKLPHPAVLFLAFTIVPGIALGAWGGQMRLSHEQRPADAPAAFDLSRLNPGEFIGFAGAIVLFGSLFLPWFKTSCNASGGPKGCNVNSVLHGSRGNFTAWQTFSKLDVLLTLACAAPFILAWIVVRGHALTWRPGEITMIVGMIAVALILLNGIVLGKPGGSSVVGISFEYGWFVGLLGAIGILAGGLLRQAIGARARKPPGVI